MEKVQGDEGQSTCPSGSRDVENVRDIVRQSRCPNQNVQSTAGLDGSRSFRCRFVSQIDGWMVDDVTRPIVGRWNG